MLNSKQRAVLRANATKIDAVFQIGKGGVADAAIKSIDDALEARELIKISVLDNSDVNVRSAADEIARATSSDVVAVIGRKIVLFRESSKQEKRIYSALI